MAAAKGALDNLAFLVPFIDTCACCRGPKDSPISLAHGDPSVMWYEVEEPLALQCFDRMKRRVENATHYRAVAVQRSRNHHARLCLSGVDAVPT